MQIEKQRLVSLSPVRLWWLNLRWYKIQIIKFSLNFKNVFLIYFNFCYWEYRSTLLLRKFWNLSSTYVCIPCCVNMKSQIDFSYIYILSMRIKYKENIQYLFKPIMRASKNAILLDGHGFIFSNVYRIFLSSLMY